MINVPNLGELNVCFLKGPAIAVRVGEGRVGDCLPGAVMSWTPPTSTPRSISCLRAVWMSSTTRCRPWIEAAALTWAFALERVTGIEPALSAWESVPSGLVMWPDLQGGVSASDRERPLVTGVNGR
jgi:hypothetical protein